MRNDEVPEPIRSALRKELFDLTYVILLSISLADWAAAQEKGKGFRILGEIEDYFVDLRLAEETIQNLWPADKRKLRSLSKLVDVMPRWLSNHREWQQFIELHGREVVDSSAARKAYQAHVESNRKYMAQIDHESEQLAADLAEARLDLTQILEEVVAKINASSTAAEARKTAKALVQEILQSGRLRRDAALEELAQYLNVPVQNLDISSFNLSEAAGAVSWARLAKFQHGI